MSCWMPVWPWFLGGALLFPPIFRLAWSLDGSREEARSLYRQLCLHGLVMLGVMAICSVAQEKVSWVWWATSFVLLALAASWDAPGSLVVATEPLVCRHKERVRGRGPHCRGS